MYNDLDKTAKEFLTKHGLGNEYDCYCLNQNPKQWEEEFVDDIHEDSEYGFMYIYEKNNFSNCKLKRMVETYLGKIWLDGNPKALRTSLKVKIKARKGVILIKKAKDDTK